MPMHGKVVPFFFLFFLTANTKAENSRKKLINFAFVGETIVSSDEGSAEQPGAAEFLY